MIADVLTTWTVIYRTGGTMNFRWNCCLPVVTKAEAKAQFEAITRMGYEASVHKTHELEWLGMPDTYDGRWS